MDLQFGECGGFMRKIGGLGLIFNYNSKTRGLNAKSIKKHGLWVSLQEIQRVPYKFPRIFWK
jgi:hypothetical protein